MSEYELRRFAGSASDVQDLLRVERRTFKECPYCVDELVARLLRPEQCLWLAQAGGRIVGFVSGLHTAGLRGRCLEADLLAVDPDWQRRGIATALLRTLRADADKDESLRGVVNLHNSASDSAFARAGFVPSVGTYSLMLYRLRGTVPRPLPDWRGEIRPLASRREAEAVAALAPEVLPGGERIWEASQHSATLLLVAIVECRVVGAAELLEVHTMLYSGLWLESLYAAPGWTRVLHPLIAAGIEVAKARRLDEVGCLVAQDDWQRRELLLREGLVPLDSYRFWMAAPLSPEAG